MKYSKQRELILNYVLSNYNHPCAKEVYDAVKKDIPNISLGTVYRNLNLLCELGEIKKIVTPNDSVKYDKIFNHHNHVYCNACQKVYDINNEQFESIKNKIQKETGHLINPNNSMFVGICKECLKIKKKEG